MSSAILVAAALAASSSLRIPGGFNSSFAFGDIPPDTDTWHERFSEPKMDPYYGGSWARHEPEFSMSQFRRELGIVHLKKGYLHQAKQTRLKALAKRHKRTPSPFVKKVKVRGIVIAR